jgi:hypothetical protein
MSVTAILAIFGSVLVGSVITIPIVLVLARKRARSDAPGTEDPVAPISMVIYVGAFVVVLIFGFAGPAIFPGTYWGSLMGTLLGKGLYFLGTMLVFLIFMRPLQALGLLPQEPSGSDYVPKSRWRKRE